MGKYGAIKEELGFYELQRELGALEGENWVEKWGMQMAGKVIFWVGLKGFSFIGVEILGTKVIKSRKCPWLTPLYLRGPMIYLCCLNWEVRPVPEMPSCLMFVEQPASRRSFIGSSKFWVNLMTILFLCLWEVISWTCPFQLVSHN